MAAASLTLCDSTSDRFLLVFFTVFGTDFCRFLRIRPEEPQRFFAVFDGLFGSVLSAHHFLVAAVGATGAAPSPNLRCKVLALFLGRVMNNLPSGVMCASGVLQGCLGVLGQGVRSGVVLARALSSACPRHSEPQPGIIALA
jgi:hypothetical protein